ncbi:MAG: hypothetical protein ACRDWS_04415 [Acidimicrobiia bacterium]
MTNEIQQLSTERERQSDLEFASRAVVYLEKKGLGVEEVTEWLMEEFGLDRETARAIVVVAA